MASSTAPAPPPTHGVPSFARRHPILTGFGILAGVSLFASYFPLSAIVTGALVAFTATGADHVAMRAARRIGSAVAARWRVRTATPPPPPPAPEPPAPQPRRPQVRAHGLGRQATAPRPHAARPRRAVR